MLNLFEKLPGLFCRNLNSFQNRSLNITDKFAVSIPNVIRLASDSQIIRDYNKVCEEFNTELISEAVCYCILNQCSASFSKFLSGLDNTYADGLDAFDKLEEILNFFNSNSSKNISLVLNSYKNYLKFSFKSHLSFTDKCSDHSVSFALNDEDKNCNHNHHRNCEEVNYSYVLKNRPKKFINRNIIY